MIKKKNLTIKKIMKANDIKLKEKHNELNNCYALLYMIEQRKWKDNEFLEYAHKEFYEKRIRLEIDIYGKQLF